MLTRRLFLMGVGTLPFLGACKPDREAAAYKAASKAQHRFRGMGSVLVVDVLPGEGMFGVEMFADDSRTRFYSHSAQKYPGVMAYPGGFLIPEKVRATWREDDSRTNNPPEIGGDHYSGKLLGDYTVTVASRIPDSFINAARKRKGSIRLKFRLHPEGLLFGWDIEYGIPFNDGTGRRTLAYDLADGDFCEARVIDGKPEVMGWYFHPKTKVRIQTDR